MISVDGVIQNQGNTTYQSPFVEIRSLGYNISAGFIAIINLAVDLSSVPAAVGVGGGFMNGRGMGPPPSGSGPPPSGTGPPPSGSGGPPPGVSTAAA